MTPLDRYKRYHAEILELFDRSLPTHEDRAKRRLRGRMYYRERRMEQLARENDSVRRHRDREHARAMEFILAHPLLGPMARAARGK